MNFYHIYNSENPETILYTSVAESITQVTFLAQDQNIDITGMQVELIRSNVKDELGRPLKANLKDALVH